MKFTREYDYSVITFVVIPTLIWQINPLKLLINIGTKYCNILTLFILCWKLSMTHCIRQILLWTNQRWLPVIKEGTWSSMFKKGSTWVLKISCTIYISTGNYATNGQKPRASKISTTLLKNVNRMAMPVVDNLTPQM